MGIVNKMFRGVAFGPNGPDEMYGGTKEKPWVAQLDVFAIGGGCQYLLAMDYVVAGSDAYMTLPARKEGIIPGAANLRLTRFVGARSGAAGDHDGPALRLRHAGRPHDLRRGRAARRGGAGGDEGRATISPRPASSAPPATGAPFASAKNRSTCSAATWRSIAASRPIAISRRR